MPAPHQIPIVDIGPLFEARSTAWEPPDRSLFAAARTTGFACISGLAPDAALGAAGRARLLEIFSLDEAERLRLYRRKFARCRRKAVCRDGVRPLRRTIARSSGSLRC